MLESRVTSDPHGPLYGVVCTAAGPSTIWQTEFLEHTWVKSGMQGELLHLVAARDGDTLPQHPTARVIRTSARKSHDLFDPSNPAVNRLHSIEEWLETERPVGTVLMLDPDLAFRQVIDRQATPGRPIGQRWGDWAWEGQWADLASEHGAAVGSLQAVTWPMLIHTADLREVMPSWIRLAEDIRTEHDAPESDRIGLPIALAELGLECDLERFTARALRPDDDADDLPIIDYGRPILDRDDRELWNKQHYHPWDPVDANPDDAARGDAAELLRMLDHFAAIRRAVDKGLRPLLAIASDARAAALSERVRTRSLAYETSRARHKEIRRYPQSVPTTVWTFWDSGFDEMPELAKLCHQSWIDQNPDWDVRFLDDTTASELLDLPELPPGTKKAAVSDVVRIAALAAFGGVWADATVYCARPLNDWLPMLMHAGFFAFADPGPDRPIDSWFLAASANSELAVTWDRAVRDYWSGRTAPDHYFWFHYLFAELIVEDDAFAELASRIPRVSADGPLLFKHHSVGGVVDEVFDDVDARSIPVHKLASSWATDTIDVDHLVRWAHGSTQPGGTLPAQNATKHSFRHR